MTEPEIPQKKPYPMQVEAGKEYHVCMCGKSQNQPLCDGSHAGSGLGPKVFKQPKQDSLRFADVNTARMKLESVTELTAHCSQVYCKKKLFFL